MTILYTLLVLLVLMLVIQLHLYMTLLYSYSLKMCHYIYVHFLFRNDIPEYLKQILKSLFLFMIAYSWINSFLLIYFSFKCTLLTSNKI